MAVPTPIGHREEDQEHAQVEVARIAGRRPAMSGSDDGPFVSRTESK
jgi:hypothetical protein